MIVLMYERRFVAPIKSGVKRHTIRRNRKRPIPIGAELSHRTWSGVAYRSKQELIMEGVCTATTPIVVAKDFVRLGGWDGAVAFTGESLDPFAVSDGFADWNDMMTYYRDRKIALPFDDAEYIEWRDTVPMVATPNTPVSCENCGACCMHMGYPPFVGMYVGQHEKMSDPDWLRLKRQHPDLATQARQGAIDGRGNAELPCLWLNTETKRCDHYDLRPAVCREFEIGDPDCIAHRQRRGIQ